MVCVYCIRDIGDSMYDKKVTLFNRYKDEDDNVFWKPTILHNVTLHMNKASNISTSGLENADSAKMHVKYKLKEGNMFVSVSENEDKQLVFPKEYQRAKDKSNLITFQNENDFFIIGTFPESIVDDNDYCENATNGFQDYMCENYDNVFTITTSDYFTMIPHVEIGGK